MRNVGERLKNLYLISRDETRNVDPIRSKTRRAATSKCGRDPASAAQEAAPRGSPVAWSRW